MPDEPRATVERIAQEILGMLGELTDPTPLRVATAKGRLSCLIQVWDTAGERSGPGERAECRADVLEVVRAAGRPLTTKEVVRALRQGGRPHGVGTVTKALAELTRSGELTNPRDRRGYRPRGWREPQTPSLF